MAKTPESGEVSMEFANPLFPKTDAFPSIIPLLLASVTFCPDSTKS